MEKQTLGTKIAALRKAQGMTQLELAQKMNVTDKAVSKWERNLACPDVHSLPKLAETLCVTVDELMLDREEETVQESKDPRSLKLLVLRCVALGMGVALVVLSLLKQLDVQEGFGLAGVGIAALAMQSFWEKE